MKNKTSFGEYFDDQRDRIVSDMQTGKNTELYNAWREDYDKRHIDPKLQIPYQSPNFTKNNQK